MKVPHETTINLDALNNKTIHHYVFRKTADCALGTFRLDNPTIAGLIVSSGSYQTGKFIQIPTRTYLDIVQRTWNETTGAPVSIENLDRAKAELDKMLGHYNLSNGDKLLPPYRFYRIDSNDDPRWQELLAAGLDNSIRIIFDNNHPGNTRTWSNIYTYNGQLRIKYTRASYQELTGSPTIYAEIYSVVSGIEEGSGNISDYIMLNNPPT